MTDQFLTILVDQEIADVHDKVRCIDLDLGRGKLKFGVGGFCLFFFANITGLLHQTQDEALAREGKFWIEIGRVLAGGFWQSGQKGGLG